MSATAESPQPPGRRQQFRRPTGMLPNRARRDHLEWLQTARFVEEIERLEQEGRCEGRSTVEDRLLLPANGIWLMRIGRLRVPSSAIQLLKVEYNGDWQFVLIGARDEEHSGWFRRGKDLRTLPGCHSYAYKYRGKYAGEGVKLRALAGLPPLPADQKKGDA